MGFQIERYNNNRVGLVVSFKNIPSSKDYCSSNNVEEAMEHFDLYLKDNQLYAKSLEEKALEDLSFDINKVSEIRSTLDSFLDNMPDEIIQTVSLLLPNWKKNTFYKSGQRICYQEKIYKVLQDHKSQEDWAPNIAPSLFAILLTGEDNSQIQEWQQPDSTNTYKIGDKVIFENKTYESLIDNNSWSPASYPAAWKLIEE